MNRKSMNFYKENGYFLFPKMVQFEITLQCPFHCSQCYKKTLDNQDMDYDYLNNIIKQAVKNEINLITLNGGEPLLYSRICDLLISIGEKGIPTNIFSSGFNLTKKVVQLLEKYKNLNFYISLNGSTKEINNLSREGFDVSIMAIRELSNYNIKFGVNWVARHDNIADFPNMLQLCRAYGISFISVTSNKLTGYGVVQSPLKKNDIALLSDYINYREKLLPSIFIESCFSMLSTCVIGNKNSFTAHCYAGISNCTVNCDGSFQPCTHLKYPERYDSIQNYWHNSQILKNIRDNPPNRLSPCHTCEHNKICSLCRAMSLDTYNNLRAGASECLNYLG